ncbi:MAG: radical SAM protein [Acidobacteria bacterium]|nr:MAG: radical SAM protein [Acidobacteriota bacterium]MCE7957676.1 radical SAM protein [Acidobacteria bacterium ACB2]
MTGAGQARLNARALAAEQPLMASLELTYACNWRCVFCYNPRHHDRSPLTTGEWVALLGDLRELGILTVSLTGGEPLAHPGFLEIARAARSRGLAVRVLTNASLVDDTRAEAIAELLPAAVEVSVHGAVPATHDAATGRPGSFAAMWAGVDRLLSRGVRVTVKTPVTRLDEREVPGMIALVRGRGLPYVLDLSITPRDDGDLSPLAFAPTEEGMRAVLSLPEYPALRAARDRKPGEPACGVGRIGLAVDPEGNVFPCVQWRHVALGNVRRTPLRQMWRGSPARREAAETATRATTMLLAEGGAVAAAPFCPALAHQLSGDALTVDGPSERRARLAAEARELYGS